MKKEDWRGYRICENLTAIPQQSLRVPSASDNRRVFVVTAYSLRHSSYRMKPQGATMGQVKGKLQKGMFQKLRSLSPHIED